MFWQRKRERALERRIMRLEQALSGLAHQAPSPNIENIVTAASSAQTATLDAMGGFIKMVSEIAVERAAVTLGRRGGRSRAKNAKRDANGRLLPKMRNANCRLCRNPMVSDPSLEELTEHFKHKGISSESEPETVETGSESGDAVSGAPDTAFSGPRVMPAGSPALVWDEHQNGGSGGYIPAGPENEPRH